MRIGDNTICHGRIIKNGYLTLNYSFISSPGCSNFLEEIYEYIHRELHTDIPRRALLIQHASRIGKFIDIEYPIPDEDILGKEMWERNLTYKYINGCNSDDGILAINKYEFGFHILKNDITAVNFDVIKYQEVWGYGGDAVASIV